MKRNEGFTLVELLVAFAVGAVVVLAATSVLLLGLRFNAISGGTAQRQNTTRILMTVFENLATEGDICYVDDDSYDSWAINDSGNNKLLHYDASSGIIYSGDNAVLVEGIIASYVKLDGNLLSFYVETEDGCYSSSVYCRNNPTKTPTTGSEETIDDKVNKLVANLQNSANSDPYAGLPQPPTPNRHPFLRALAGELGSTGKIVGGTEYYSTWYQKDWPITTPWCGCYVSWALCQETVKSFLSTPAGRDKWYADVDDFYRYFTGDNWVRDDGGSDFQPQPGDIIFFDWDNGDDPEHIGVVLYVDSSTNAIYTIEGNSAGIVAVRKYSPVSGTGTTYDYIIGYGKLPWT